MNLPKLPQKRDENILPHHDRPPKAQFHTRKLVKLFENSPKDPQKRKPTTKTTTHKQSTPKPINSHEKCEFMRKYEKAPFFPNMAKFM